ncbi:hypothetical protein BH09PLA1_BH09PLA1_03490 [soil metagenome]
MVALCEQTCTDLDLATDTDARSRLGSPSDRFAAARPALSRSNSASSINPVPRGRQHGIGSFTISAAAPVHASN